MNRIGIDIVDNRRIGNMMSDSFLKHVLSEAETKEYSLCNDKIAYIAGRFAAKEAIIKCLVDKKITDLTKITILHGSFGEPLAYFEGHDIQVSISHEKDYTVAIAMLI